MPTMHNLLAVQAVRDDRRPATVVKRVSIKLRTGSTFCQEGGNEICALLGYYAAHGGNFFPTFRDHYHHALRNVPEERRSHLLRD
jgi:hypothetical protein